MSEDKNMSAEQREYRKTCVIADSDLCNWLDRKGCYHCYISTLKSDEEKKTAMERWKTTLSYVPDNFDDLHSKKDRFPNATHSRTDSWYLPYSWGTTENIRAKSLCPNRLISISLIRIFPDSGGNKPHSR